MSRQAKDITTQFNGGEFSPLMEGRTDVPKHAHSCITMQNFVPLPHGPATRIPGKRYIADCKAPTGYALLLHCDGADGATVWADAAGSLVVQNGSPVLNPPVVDVQESVFGGGSVYFSGAGNATTDHSGIQISGGASAFTFNPSISQGDFIIDFRIRTFATSGLIIGHGVASQWSIDLSSGKIKYGDSTNGYLTSATAINDGVWHHIAIMRDAAGGELSIFIDGTRDANDAAYPTGTINSGVTTYIGYANTYGGTAFRGHLEEIRISKGVIGTNIHPTSWLESLTSITVPQAPWGYKRSIPFIFNDEQAYTLTFGNEYIRFYTRRGQIVSGASPYEIASPYKDIDLVNLQYSQDADVMELTCKGYAPRQLVRNGNADWEINTKTFSSPPTIELGWEPNSTLTPAATTGSHVIFTCQHAIFTETARGGIIEATAGGKATILSVLVTTTHQTIMCRILEDFPSTDAIAAGSWKYYRGVAELTPTVVGPVGSSCTLKSTGNIGHGVNCVTNGGTNWTQSAAVNEEYWIEAGAIRPSAEPSKVFIAGVEATKGTVGSLEQGQWGWGDNGAEAGGNTVYVRIASDADPDTHGAALPGYVFYVVTTTVDATIFDVVQNSDVGRYVRINAGLVRIDAVLNSKTATGTIMKALSGVSASTAWTFEEEMWSDDLGWPYAVAHHNGKLLYGGTDTYPEYMWGSEDQKYDRFPGGTDDTDSFAHELRSQEVNIIKWLASADALIAGTSGGEFTVTGTGGVDTPITPSSIRAKMQASHGSDRARPVVTHTGTLYASQKFTLREFVYYDEKGKYEAPDLALIAEHIPGENGGIKEMAYQKTPYSIVWILFNNGVLGGLTYLKEHEVIAWHKHPLGGTAARVESICSIPGENDYYELWMIASRVDDQGDRSYHICLMDDFWKNKDVEDAFFVDFGLTYDGASSSSIGGLDHLEGETVKVLGDGQEFDDATVSGGAITTKLAGVTTTVNKAQIGLGYTSRIKVARNKGAQGSLRSIKIAILRLFETLGVKHGADEDDLDTLRLADLVEFDPTAAYFTGDIKATTPSKTDYAGYFTIEEDGAVPCTVVALVKEVSYGD